MARPTKGTQKTNSTKGNEKVNRWNDINGEIVIFHNVDYDTFSTSFKDNEEGNEKNRTYINVFMSKKCNDKVSEGWDNYVNEKHENMLTLDIVNGWLYSYKGKINLFINDIK